MREPVPRALAGERLDRVVAMLTSLSRSQVAELVASGEVRVDGRPITSRAHRLVEDDVIELEVPDAGGDDDRPRPDPEVAVDVVHADEHVVVVDKPAGLVVHPGAGHGRGTLVHGLLARFPEIAHVGEPRRPGIVHRLDRDTSGLLVVARTEEARVRLAAQLKAREVDRGYLALAWGRVASSAGVVDAPVGRATRDRTRMAVSARGRPARTRYRVRSLFTRPAPLTLLECSLESGRTHQIRVHLAAIDHPIVGDRRYGGAKPSLPLARPFLHAWHLAFDHPVSGERRHHESPLPDELEAVLAELS